MRSSILARASGLITIIAICSQIQIAATAQAATNTWLGTSGFEWGTSGNWTTTNVSGIPATGDTLLFDGTGNNTSPSDDNLGNAFSIATLNFANGASSYTLTSNLGANDQSLTLTTSLVNQASGQTQTINFPIAGTGTLFMGGTTGTGGVPDTNGNATLRLNANAQFGALISSVNNAAADTIQIGNGQTLTVNGSITVGGYNTSAGVSKLAIIGATPGNGGLVATPGGTAVFAVGDYPGGSPATGTNTSLDLSGIANFSFTGQQVDVGGNQSANTGNRALATLTLASTSNTIKVTGTSGVTVAGGSTSNGGTSTLNLSGTGTNTIWTPTLFLGTLKSFGTVQFGSGSGGTFTLRNAAGTGRAAINVGLHNGAGAAAAHGTLNLTGHSVDILASTLTVGSITGAVSTGTVSSTASFDTGTIDVTSIILGQRTGSAFGTTTGTLTMGGGNLIVNSAGGGSFGLGSNASSSAGSTTGIFNLSGGTATINSNITVGPVGSGTTAQINLTGGTLSMGNGVPATNFAIGTAAAPITTFNMPTSGQTATIQNLGGTGIYANGGSGLSSGGLSMSDSGTLILGANTYGGTTNVNGSGTLQLNNATSVGTSILNYTSGTLVFGPSVGTFQLGGLSGTSNINLADTASAPVTLKIANAGGSYGGQLSGAGGLTVQGANGTTVQTFTANQSYTAATSIAAGTLQLQGAQLYASPAAPATTTITGGILAGFGHVNGPVSLSTGSIAPDIGGTALELNSLTTGGGTLAFNLNGSTISHIVVDGAAALNAGTLTMTGTLPTPATYVLLTAATLSHSGFTLPADFSIGASTVHTFFLGNNLEATITGAPSALIWVGASPTNGTGIWDLASTKSWNNQTTNTNPDFFHNLDTLQFNNAGNNATNIVTINATAPVSPAATTFSNTSSQSYVINSNNGNGIGGAGGLTVNGTGSVTLNEANSYSGNTTVSSGTLIVGSNGTIVSTNANISGGTLNVSGLVSSTKINISGSGALSVAAGGSLSGAGATVTVGNSSGTGFTVASGSSVPATLNLVNNGTTTFNSSQTIATLNGSSGAALAQSSGTLTVSGGGIYAGAINGASGGLTVAGGTLVLTGANNYGGTTTVNSGATLQIDDGIANTGSLSSSSTIANSGTLVFARTDSPAAIANTISGTGLIEANGNSGTITLSGNNSAFAGSTGVYSGTLQQGSANALGAATVALFVGQPTGPAGGTTPGNLSLGFNTQVGSFSAFAANTTTAPTSTVTIPTGVTLTVNGAFLIGAVNGTANTFDNTTNLTGGGSLVVAGSGNFIVGQPSNNAAGAKDTTNSDMSQLSSIGVNTTGIFAVGYGANSRGTLSLADNAATGTPSNFINASEIDVGNSLSDNNVGQCVLTLGSGTNVLQGNTINIGLGKTGGSVTWAGDASTSSSVTIAGTGGGSALATIIISGQNSATSSSVASNLLLAGHVAHVQASTLLIGGNIGNTAGGANGTVTFDTGAFDVGSVSIGAYSSGTSTTGPTGALTIGGSTPNTAATGVFNIHGPLTFGNVAVTTAATATATLTINSGTVNVGGRISSPSLFGATNSTLTLAGNGVLNMSGFSIGGAGSGTSGDNSITTVSLAPNGDDTPTLANLGGAGINAAGLNTNGSGTLILDGFNTYTGGTAVNSGTLQVGKASSFAMYSPLGASSGTVTVGSALNFASNSAVTVANAMTGSGQINVNGSGKVSLSGNGSFTGQTNINAGTLAVQGALNNTGTPGILTVGGGTLAGSGATGADVSLNTGSIAPDSTGSALTVNSLTTNGGTLRFNVDGASIGKISSASFANLNSGSLAFGLITAPTLSSYTILTSTSLANSITITPSSAGRTTFTPAVSGNNLVVNVSGGPATLTWNNSSGGNGTDWDVVGQQNWNSTAATDPHRYYQFDNVNFTDSKGASSSTVNLNTTVTPLSLTVNTANAYTIQGSGSISGSTGLTLTGGGTLNLSNTGGNNYTGATNVASGTLRIGAPGAVPNGTALTLGSTSKLDLGGNTANLASVSGSGTIGNSSTSTDSAVIYAGAGSATYSGAVIDALPGGNKKTGVTVASGSLILTGNNSYSGPTIINGTTALQVGNGSTGSLGSATAITDNGQLIYNVGSSPVISNNISGVGQLVQSGSGTLVLTGANSYGPTIINSGAVQVGNGAAAGSLGQGPVTDNGSLRFNLSSNLTFGSGISGTGSVVQAGAGTVVLPSNNNYSGGTSVTSGTLQVGGTGGFSALGTGNVTVGGGATLVGANADAFGFNGGAGTSPLNINIAGGTVTDIGTANYRLTMPNIAFSGGTLTSTVGNNGDVNGQYSLQGTVLNGVFTLTTNAASTTAVISAPTVSVASNATFNVAAGNVTGGPTPSVDLLVTSALKSYNTQANPVIKTGSGVMVVTGTNVYTGTTTVSGGTLLVNGTHVGGGDYSVANTATLGGSGTISSNVNVVAGGFLAPGAGIGTLHISGTTTLAGTLNTDLQASLHDVLDSTGPLSIGASAAANFTLLGNITTTHFVFANYPSGGLTGAFGATTFSLGPSAANVPIPTGASITNDTVNHQLVLNVSPQSLRGNFNLDGTVDASDIPAMLQALTDLNAYKNGNNALHVTLTATDLNALGDFDNTGGVTNGDIQPMLDYIAGLAGGGSVAAVPEPLSLGLLSLGGIFLIARRRMRRNHSA